MKLMKVVLLGVLGLSLVLVGCTKEEVVDTPQQESVTKALTQEKVEANGKGFRLSMADLKVDLTVSPGGKEILGTPTLRGKFKIANTSGDLLKFQSITLEYLDKTGKVIPFQSGEKTASVSSFSFSDLKPGDTLDGNLDVSFPRVAVKDLGKINVNVVYLPTPFVKETLGLSESVK
jgi:hypothetical protein